MDSPTAQLKATQCEQEHDGSDNPSSKDCSSKRDSGVHTGSAGTPVWVPPPSDASMPLILPHPQQHAIQPGMMDPFSLRFQCPCPSTQCQMTYPDYLLDQSSQYHLLTSPMPGPADSSQHSSFSPPWFEPILCSMMPGDLHSPLFSVCPPQAMDHQQVHDGLTEVTSHIPHMLPPVVCNMSGSGQVAPVNHCEPGPVFLTLESAPTHREDGPGQVKEPLYRHTKTACSLYEAGDRAVHMQPPAPPARAVGTVSESKSRKPCHCTRSQCLKLYCDCFANGVMCNNCDCSNCHNNAEHETKRHKAIKSCLGRNPDAFRPKIAGGRSGVVKGWHNKGCNCKRSNCLKNYCECYEANIMCTSSCKCVGCRNYNDSSEMSHKDKSVKDKWPVSVVTRAVVDAVCGCLLAQAEEAEREDQSPAQAESMVLEEFGHCITQIVKAMFKPIDTLQ